MKTSINGQFDYDDGDELFVRGKAVARVQFHETYIDILCYNEVETSIFIGDINMTQREIDDAVNCVYAGLSVGLTWNK